MTVEVIGTCGIAYCGVSFALFACKCDGASVPFWGIAVWPMLLVTQTWQSAAESIWPTCSKCRASRKSKANFCCKCGQKFQ